EDVVEPHQAAPDQRVVDLIQRANAGNLVDRTLLQMILQIAPDAVAVEHDIDAEGGEPVRGADAGAMQQLHRSDRAGAQDDFALRAGLEDLATPEQSHADAPPTLDDETDGQHLFSQ